MSSDEIDLDLEKHLRLTRISDRKFTAQIPEGWHQGRGTFGGVVMGLLARSMEAEGEQEGRLLRSLMGEVNAPVLPGPAELTVELIRAGNKVTSLSTRLVQDGEVRAHASASYGTHRISDRELLMIAPPSPPEVPRFEDVPEVPVEPPFGPAFGRAFEFRPLEPFPYSGSTTPGSSGYLRARKRLSRLGGAEVVCHADCYWPTAMCLESAPRPIATLGFTFQACLDPFTLDPEQPLFHRARLLSAHDGYVHELRELWTPDGRLVSLNPQTFVIVR